MFSEANSARGERHCRNLETERRDGGDESGTGSIESFLLEVTIGFRVDYLKSGTIQPRQ